MVREARIFKRFLEYFFERKKSHSTVHFVKVIPIEDKARCIAAIEKWNEQKYKKDERSLILGPSAYKGENINEPIGYLLQLFADKDHLDISDFWRIYDSIEIEKECNV